MTRFTRQGLQGLALSVSFVLSVNTWAISVSPSPSYTGSYTLTWFFPTGCSSNKYWYECTTLQEKTGNGSWNTVALPGWTFSKTFTNKTANTYQYRIYSSAGFAYDGPITVQVLAPSTPSSPTGPSSSSSGNYTIDWGDSTGASHYQYREYLTGWSEAVSTGGNSHITVSNKSSGRWYYQARACNPAGCSGWTGGDKYIDVARTPGVPSSLSVSPGASTTASHSVSWGGGSGSPTGYHLYRSINGGGYTHVGGAAQTFTGLGNGSYVYRVLAYKTVGAYTSYSGYRYSSTATVTSPPSFSISDATIQDEGTGLSFTITKRGATSTSYSVNYATADGTATAGSDYTRAGGTRTFTTAQASHTVTVPVSQDSVFETNETLYVNLSAATGGAGISDSQGSGTIRNDDAPPSFSIDDVSVTEGGNLVFTVTKAGATALSHSVNYATAIHTAAGSDYTGASGTLTFSVSETSKTVTVSTTQDSLFEQAEILYLNLSSPTNGATLSDSQGSGTINNDDAPPSFSIDDVSVTEGSDLVFTVTKTGATALSHNVSYASADNTAVGGSDYTALSPSPLSFAPGDTSKTVTVATTQEPVYEKPETLYINLSGPGNGATLSDSQGIGTINNDDAPPSFGIDDVSISEGGSLSFTVSKTGATEVDHAVNYATADNTALATDDYTASSGTLTFAAGAATSQSVSVATVEDGVYENPETLYINLSGPGNGATLSDSQGIGTITDDDTAPSFSINTVFSSEGDGTVSFTVTRTGSTNVDHAVNYATTEDTGVLANNRATVADDYTASSGTLTFLASGPATRTVTVTIVDDKHFEYFENFLVVLSRPTNGASLDAVNHTGTASITDNEPSPYFTVSDASVNEDVAGGMLTFSVRCDGFVKMAQTVDYTLSPVTAQPVADYQVPTTSTVVLCWDQVASTYDHIRQVSIPVVDDDSYEGEETFTLTLSNPRGGAIIGNPAVPSEDGVGVGTITDIGEEPSFSVDNAATTEGGNLSFTVTKSSSSALSHSVSYATADNTATLADGDYTAASGTLTFLNTENTKTVTVSSLQDTRYENSETLVINLETATGGALISDSRGIGTINNDDAVPAFSIDDVSVTEGSKLVFTVSLTGASSLSHSIDYKTTDNTASNSSDYTASSGTLTFKVGETTKTITVVSAQDKLYENNETLNIHLTTPTNGALISDAQGIGTINNDDAAPAFSVDDIAESEGTVLSFTVTKTGATALSHNIDYVSVDNTATLADGDYLQKPLRTLSFSPGETSKTVTVTTLDDLVYENNEGLFLNLSNATAGATISDNQGEGTINNNDTPPSFSLSDQNAVEGKVLTFLIMRTGLTGLTHTVDYATADGTATLADSDYTHTTGTLSFGPDDSDVSVTQNVVVNTAPDDTLEADETFTVDLSNASNAATIRVAQATGTLTNDDFAPNSPASISLSTSGRDNENHILSWAVAGSAGAAVTRYELEQSIDGEDYSKLYTGTALSHANNGLGAGSYVYRVKACNVSGCSPWRVSSAQVVIPSPTDPDGILTVVSNPTSYAPGLTPGEFSVDASGGANYQLPIAVPPGTAGMQPSLSLSYNHRTGNALLGQGWTLGGLSVITRCPTTAAQDGGVANIDGIDFDANDKYCIDGERLINVSGSYGANNTEYRTELDGFTKVISYGTAGSGPEKFIAYTRSGQILEYGYTTDSRIEAQGKSDVRLWAVNKIRDTVGNYLTVSYTEDTEAYRPDRIDYTGNASASPALSPYASVRFEYATRTDLNTLYLSGSRVKTTKRLTNIKTYVGATEVRDYQLTYDNNGQNGVSRLTQVQACAGTACFPPTVFNWDGDGAVPDFDNHQLATLTTWSDFNIITGDWNGDGRTDVFLQHRRQGASTMYTANTDGTLSSTGYSTTSWWAGEDSTTTVRAMTTGDWNGDGKTDLAVETVALPANPSSYPYTLNHTVTLYHSTGTAFSANGYSVTGTSSIRDANDSLVLMIRAGDWNGDGRTDLFLQKDEGQSSQLYTANSRGHMVAQSFSPVWDSNRFSLKAGDFNADGRTDFIRCHISTGTIAVYLSTGTSLSASGYSPSGWQVYNLVPGDYNGDGNTDLFLDRNTAGTSHLYFATGDGHFVDSGYSSTDWAGAHMKAIAGDWNGDGKADLIRTGGDLYLGTGTGLNPVGFGAGLGTALLSAGDWNGDGLSDIISKPTGYSQSATQYTTSHSGFDVITKITDGLGKETDIVYKPATDRSVHTPGTGASYPEIDFQGALYVVDNVRTDNGIGGQSETRYDYAGARLNVAGRGFLGFASMTALDVSTDIQSTTTYRQDYPYTGLVGDTEQRLHPAGGNLLLGKVTSSYASLTTHTGVTFPYASQVVKQDYDIPTGSSSATLVSTTTTTSTYDSHGNPLTIKVEVRDGTDTYTTFTDNSYTNTTGTWLLGRLTRAEVTQYLPGNGDLKDGSCTAATPRTCDTRSSSFVYHGTTGLLTREVIEPDTPALTLQTDYLHDDFGNRTSVTVTGGSGATAIASRTTRTAYDSRGQFATTVTNALGHVETRTYDDKVGVMLTLQGPNLLTTQWEYDAFGRRTKETRADNTLTQIERAWCTSDTCPSRGTLKVVTTTSGAPASAVISDSLGRQIKQARIGFDRTVIEVDTVYDAKGRVEKTSRPYFAGTASGNILWHSVTYDDLGRPLTETAPGTNGSGTGGVIITATRYNGLEVSLTNDKNQVNTRRHNVRGELKGVADANNKSTDYRYDPFGNLIEVIVDAGTGGEQVSTTNTYDLRGRKTSMDDPDMGSWSYQYNALGELTSQTDAKGQTTTMTYDLLGRLVSRIDDEGGSNAATSTWVYDSETTYGAGQSNRSIGKRVKVTGGEGDQKTYLYDSYGLPDTTTTWIDDDNDGVQDAGEVYTVSQTYDQFSRVDSVTYPESPEYPFGLNVTNHYSVDGHLKTVRNTDSNALYWRAEAQNAQGQLLRFEYGNGITTQQGFDAGTGLIDSIRSHTALAGPGVNDVQDYRYDFDSLGNLTQRVKKTWASGVVDKTYTADYGYDSLSRLTQSDYDDGTNPVITRTFNYDAIGNLKYKSDISSSDYLYGSQSSSCTAAGPHAAVEVDGHCLGYDANGNQTTGYNFTRSRSRTLTWTPYNKPKTIVEGSTTLTFSYGADRARFKQVNTTTNLTTWYIGGLYEKQVNTGTDVTTHVHYIRAGGTAIAIYRAKEDTSTTPATAITPTELRYLHRDHIGSVTEITDETAAIVEKLAYDAWGKRRAPAWTDALAQLSSTETFRGFTGHEMLDDVSLIHMNGRVYDPDLGRFLSPDPFIQQGANAQNFNRYTYVGNNPLSFTDPSGFFFKKLFKGIGKIFKGIGKAFRAIGRFIKKHIRTIAAIGAAVVGNFVCGPACAGFAAGMVSSGGDLKAGLIGAVTGGITGGLNIENIFLNALAHGVVQGVATVAQGGKFLSGFLSGAVSGGFGAKLGASGKFSIGKLVASAVVGGVAAELGGGKFENGAVSGAFAYVVANKLEQIADEQYTEQAFAQAEAEGVFSVGPETLAVHIPGTTAGDNAALYWATLQAETGNPLYALPGATAALWTPDTAVDTLLTLGGGGIARGLSWAMGPRQQWIRLGGSYSHYLGQRIGLSLRWGASPAGGGQYIRQIPSTTMQRVNQWFRGLKLPGSSWRTQDPGHLHIRP